MLISLLVSVCAAAVAKSSSTTTLDESTAVVLSRLDGLEKWLVPLLQEMRKDQQEMRKDIKELTDSTVTVANAESTEACARKTVALLIIGFNNGTNAQCSAFPFPFANGVAIPVPVGGTDVPEGNSIFFISSGHCFRQSADVQFISLTALGHVGSYSCELVVNMQPEKDIAALRCDTVPMKGSTLVSLARYRIYQPVALVGFSAGQHREFMKGAFVNGVSYPQHVKFTRLSNTLQSPTAPTSSGAVDDPDLGILEDIPFGFGLRPAVAIRPGLSDAAGYTDTGPHKGMSGGAVVDISNCEEFGPMAQRSTFGQGGSFVLLTRSLLGKLVDAIDAHQSSLVALEATADGVVTPKLLAGYRSENRSETELAGSLAPDPLPH